MMKRELPPDVPDDELTDFVLSAKSLAEEFDAAVALCETCVQCLTARHITHSTVIHGKLPGLGIPHQAVLAFICRKCATEMPRAYNTIKDNLISLGDKVEYIK